jgi:hypothetical protein
MQLCRIFFSDRDRGLRTEFTYEMAGKRSGLLAQIAATENVSLCALMKN